MGSGGGKGGGGGGGDECGGAWEGGCWKKGGGGVGWGGGGKGWRNGKVGEREGRERGERRGEGRMRGGRGERGGMSEEEERGGLRGRMKRRWLGEGGRYDHSQPVTPKKVLVSALTNDEKVLGANVAILISVVDEIRDKFANTLYGYFVGERLAFPIVEAYVTNSWKKYGFERAIFHNGLFFFKFSSHDGMIKMLEGGPWFIRAMPIFLNEWSANTKLKKEVITKVPVWVKIHNVPVVAFLETGLSLIATQLGRPIRLDACTSDMCLNPWGRNSYAQILVELNSENEVMESIVVAIPLPKGDGHYLETLVVEYEWWPTRPVSKLSTTSENTSKSKAPPTSKEAVNEAAKPKVSHEVRINDSSCSTNENGYFKDGIDLGQLQGNMKKLMDENKVLELNTDCVTEDVAEVHSVPNANMISTKSKSVPVEVNECVKGSLLEQFLKSHDASTSNQNKFSESDESEVEEVSMPFGKSGGGFLDDLEDDLDRYDGYKAHVYDLTEQEQAFCDRYDIRLNSRCKK
ncbi:zinc knuckle CX2CX4HX4C containing protein [Tanacetum coccineum]